jgi:hypothetical protein
MIGNKQCIGVCEYALKETMCTLSYCWRTEGISHFHENPGSGDQWLTQVLSCLDSNSMEMIGRVQESNIVEGVGKYFRHGNGFPWA